MSMFSAFLLVTALAAAGALAGGLGLAMLVAPYRGQTGKLPPGIWSAIFVATFFTMMPAFAVLLGTLAYKDPKGVALVVGTILVTVLPLALPSQRLRLGARKIVASLAVAALLALSILFWAAPAFHDARRALHAACRDASRSFIAARPCQAQVDARLALPDDLTGADR